GYRGHNAQNPRRVFISGQKRGVFGVIKRELRRRSAIEPIIGHLKAEGHLGRCYLKGRAGDAANVVLSAVGHNFRRVLAWLRDFLRLILTALPARRLGALGEGSDALDHLAVVNAEAFPRRVAEMRRQHDVIELAERV
ncbi:hypothetical protein KXV61_008786, partial [Aspergillus fumigatus]